MKKQTLIIGTRGSVLALKQVEIVSELLQRHFPDIQISTKIIKTEGDKNQNPIPQTTIGKSWFTKEIEKELKAGLIDIAVHSLKDLPNTLPTELILAGMVNREDPRDVLVSKENKKLSGLKTNAVIGTDSNRRAAQILHMRPDLQIKSIRGNVPTRLEKLLNGNEYDGVILAMAGLKRLDLLAHASQIFEVEELVPAPGQGILAIETREKSDAFEYVKKINDPQVSLVASTERTFSALVGGGCKMPVGGCAQIHEKSITLIGMLGMPDGSEIVKEQLTMPIDKASELSRQLSQKLLEKCSPKCLSLLKQDSNENA